MGKMKKHFNQVAKLVEEDKIVNGATVSLHLNKLTEEVGEFAQVINKTLGIKGRKRSDTDAVIKDNIGEEAADMIQIIVGICHLNGVGYSDIMDHFEKKNYVYEKFIEGKKNKTIDQK
jgi:NTP pyrophosphatase (non-canonical NTP hydrolase)